MFLASLFLGAALAERGADADFQIAELSFGHAVLTNVRFGAEAAPDASIALVEARWGWRGLTPALQSVHIVEPRLRAQLDRSGRVSAGALDRLRGRPSPRRPGVPAVRLEIVSGQALITAPFGALTAQFSGDGVLGEDFSATARIEETTRPGEDYRLTRGRGELVVVSRDNTIAFRLLASAEELRWGDMRLNGAALWAMGRATLDLGRYDVEAAWRAERMIGPNIDARRVTAAAGVEALARADALDPAAWVLRGHADAGQLTLAGVRAATVRIEANAQGRERDGTGDFSLTGENLAGLALTSQRPSARGRFTLDWRNTLAIDANADIALAQSRFDARAQERLRRAFPDLPQAPIGPTFAQAERALDAAADSFDLAAPVRFVRDGDGSRLIVAAPITAQARTGALLRLSPLRTDGPALTLAWRELLLRGAVAVELSGGGAPNAALLIDSLTWAPDAAFDADGTLTVSNWRADGAEIAAQELGLSLTVTPGGEGQLALIGPARITGPLGEGQVRDMTAALDLAVRWGDGWRVTPNGGCVPIRLGGLDAAGLSFAGGAFSLCQLDNALIAANASGRLSGGFAIESLALSGVMAGPQAQPARLSASRITGRFGGTESDTRLALEANAPALAIDMGEDRRLNLVLQRLTADARIADSWSIEGAFAHGGLTDPALPGAVSAIAGRWSASPIDGAPVIRMLAGEALLTAHPPEGPKERPLFQQLRLSNVEAVLADGRINADGAILLEESDRELARFMARHDVSEGVGEADVRAAALTFDETLQPYQLSELARGLIENVRGRASVEAGIVWTRDDIRAAGRVQLHDVSLATATIPIVEGVNGDIVFDDLFALTTPPGQTVRIGRLNPGVAVEDGVVRFQLLDDGRVRVEGAEFAFASGALAMAPATIWLGADETEFVLTLSDVDAATLLATLNMPDLTATGRLQGRFPLTLTRTNAFIRDGELRAQPGGGAIAYTGDAGDAAIGPARVAFDALREFRYDELSITLNGDLAGEVVGEINFSGVNTGRPVDLGEITAVPGVGRVTVRGVPFVFNVQVRAPFRRLAETAASFTNPGQLIRQGEEQDGGEPVDQQPPAPR